tara:strand:- start:6871 stop:7155 length:285 start_codon:yes stop_codon:yes gene_type:complete
MTKKKETTTNQTVEVIGGNEKYKVCIDLNAAGNAEGGKFVTLKGLKDAVGKNEASGVNKVIGFVYDGTDRLEILTQAIIDKDLSDIIESVKVLN